MTRYRIDITDNSGRVIAQFTTTADTREAAWDKARDAKAFNYPYASDMRVTAIGTFSRVINYAG